MTSPEAHAIFERAVARHRAGELTEAAALYREVLKREAAHEQAAFLSAAIAIDQGELPQAVLALEALVRRAPHNPLYWSNLGEAQRRAGDDESAVQSLLRAVRLKPDLAQAHFNLGLATRRLGEASAALGAFERAVDLKPDEPQLQHALASALVERGELARALGHFQCALLLAPRSLAVHFDYARCLRKLRRFDAAVAAASRALSLQPEDESAYLERGASLLELGRTDESLADAERALQLAPGRSAALCNAAAALTESGRLNEALEAYRRAVSLEPTDHVAHSNLVYLMAFAPEVSESAILTEARAWSERHATPLARHRRDHENDANPSRRLRVGYVSSNLHSHALALFLLPTLRAHDRDKVELFAYASLTRNDEITASLRDHFEHWHDISTLEPQAAAELIRSHGIDVLVDLTMHMSVSLLRVFACKPAPVQICWLAYPGTTGVAGLDYRLTDPHLDPPSAPKPYSEESLTLADTFWCYEPGSDVPSVSPLPALTRGHVTFGCLNTFWKLNDQTLSRFAAVLRRCEGSRLTLLAPDGTARARVAAFFEHAGIRPERLHFVSRRPRAQYLALYSEIDIALDTLPYAGHTTSLDALYMGVPVISLLGQTVVGRAGASHAANLGIPWLCAESEAEWTEQVVTLASDLPRLAQLRTELRARLERSPLMDAERFARQLELQYRVAWRRWCETAAR